MRKIKIICCMLLIFALGFGVAGRSVQATDKDMLESQKIKYYKSVQIHDGDTLWTIAEDNLDVEYDTVNTYVKELMRMNNLVSDELTNGYYLTVYYYDTI